jgi:hypothetical protein
MKNYELIEFHHLFDNEDTFLRELRENQVWYRGNPEELEYFFKQVYNVYQKSARSPYAVAESQTKFWRTVSGDVPRVHSGLPKLATQAIVNLIAGNGYDININDNEAEVERLQEILDENDFDSLLQEAISTEAWAGFVYFKISHDLELSEKPIIEVVSPFDAKCEVKRGRVKSITFIVKQDQDEEEEIEIHEKYYLENGKLKVDYKAYKKEQEVELPEEYQEYETNYPLTFIPAMLKNNTGHNSRFPNLPYGESDFTSVQSLFHMLDDLMSQTELEVSNAIATKFINSKLIPKDINGKPYKYDRNQTNQEITSNDMEDDAFDLRKFVSVLQPDIRVDRYDQVIRDTYARILTNMGISPLTVGLPGFESVQASAASQREREKASIRTRAKKLKLWKEALTKLFANILKYDDYLNNRSEGAYEITVDFAQYAVPTLDERIQTIGQAVQLNIMSIEKAVDELYPELSEEERNKIILEIKLEQGVPLTQDNLANQNQEEQ